MKIKTSFSISEDIYNKCLQFGKDSVGSSADKYARRNQFNIDKIINDIRNGKIAEEIVYQALSPLYPKLSQPDYNIYDKKNKSWDPDLKEVNIPLRIGVKSQDIKSEIDYGRSWVFQGNQNKKYDTDTGVFGKELDDNHYITFVSLNVPKRTAEIRAVVKIKWLHEKDLFKPMKQVYLQNNKTAVYYDNLEQFPEELFQL